MLSEDAITSFQDLYQKEFGIKIDKEEASQRAYKFLRLFKLVNHPLPKSWVDKNKRKK